MVGRVRRIEGVHGKAGRDLAGDDAVEGVGPGDAAEVQVLEQQLGSVADGNQRRTVEGVGDAKALEGMPQRITYAQRRALTGLRIVLQVLQVGRRQIQILSGGNGILASLIIVGLPGIDLEAGLDGPVKQVGLGESEHQVALTAAETGVYGKRLAQSKEIVGAVIETDKGAGQTADAALQSDAVLPFLMHFQREIDCAILLVQVAFGRIGIVGLELIKIAELVQAQQAQLPVMRVVDLAFLQCDFAADDFVAGGGVALELDAAHVELFAFVDVERYVHDLLFVIETGVGNAGVVDVAILTVSLAQVLDALGHFFAAENVAILHRDKAAESGVVPDGFVVLEGNGAEAIAIPLLDGHGDVDRFPHP